MNAALLPRISSLLVLVLCAIAIWLVPFSSADSGITITTTTPTNGQTISRKVTWQVDASGPVDHINFYIDDSSTVKWTEWHQPYVYNGDGSTLDTTTLSNGTHTLRAVAYTSSGSTQSTSVQVNVANSAIVPAPRVSISQPADGQTISGKVPWTATVDGGIPSKVDFAIDGQTKWTEFLSPYVFNGDGSTLDTTTLSSGSHTLAVTAYTTGGRASQASITVNVSNGTSSPSSSPTPIAVVAPSSTAAPTIGGTPAVGTTLTATNGTWSGTAPLTYAVAWQRCASSGCVAIAGATAATYVPVSADVGSSLRVSVKASNAAGSSTATSAQVGPVQQAATTPLPTTTDQHTWSYWATLPAPAFTPKRTIVVTSRTAFDSAWANLQPGDYVDVRGVVFSGELALSKQLSGWAEVHFDSASRATGTAYHSRLPAVWLNNVQNVRFYGLDITNPTGGPGLTIYNGNVAWWDFKIHDTASGGGGVFAVNSVPAKADLRGEIWHTGLDTWFDSHQPPTGEAGSGLHGFYIADDRGPVSGRFILNVHDQPTGAGVEIGPGASGIDLSLLANRMTFDSVLQVGGNALQFWSYVNHPRNVDVHYLEAHDCHGRAVDTNGMSTSENVRVDYGRATNMLLNTLPGNTLDDSPVGRIVWDTRGGISYGDIAPLP